MESNTHQFNKVLLQQQGRASTAGNQSLEQRARALGQRPGSDPVPAPAPQPGNGPPSEGNPSVRAASLGAVRRAKAHLLLAWHSASAASPRPWRQTGSALWGCRSVARPPPSLSPGGVMSKGGDAHGRGPSGAVCAWLWCPRPQQTPHGAHRRAQTPGNGLVATLTHPAHTRPLLHACMCFTPLRNTVAPPGCQVHCQVLGTGCRGGPCSRHKEEGCQILSPQVTAKLQGGREGPGTLNATWTGGAGGE